MEEAYLKTVAKTRVLRQLGYTVVEAWECKVHKELKQNPQMKQYFKDFKIEEPLGPREALFGGRTNALKLYHVCRNGEQIRLVDVCSL